MRRCFPALLLLATASCAVVRPSAPAPAPGYVVFFDEKSADLPQDAMATVQQAAIAANAHPDQPVAVIGYTDSAGNAAADSLLSDRRAKRVFLTANAQRLLSEMRAHEEELNRIVFRNVPVEARGVFRDVLRRMRDNLLDAAE